MVPARLLRPPQVASVELRAALQFAVLALVVLPLIPAGSYGPWGAFEPRLLWIVVLVFSALNFAAYMARKLIGETHGLAVTGALGGLVSSTAVTLTFSRRSRQSRTAQGRGRRGDGDAHDEPLALPLALGVVAACTILVPRVVVIATALEPAVGGAVAWVTGPSFVLGVLIIAVAVTRQSRSRAAETGTGTDMPPAAGAADSVENPLGLWSSLQMAAAFQVVMFVLAWAENTRGVHGVLATSALLGLTNMDALTLSMSRHANESVSVDLAAAAMGVGVLANTLFKLGIAAVFGARRFRRYVAAGLLSLALALAVGIVLRWP